MKIDDLQTGNNYCYAQININEYEFLRFFEAENFEPLPWHKDANNRDIFIINAGGWFLQMDEQPPCRLQNGKFYKIDKEKYHRVIPGKGMLVIKIREIADDNQRIG